MIEQFTVPEINLICIFGTASRAALISDLIEAITDFDTGDPLSDNELFEIAHNTLSKISKMSDAEFAVLAGGSVSPRNKRYPIYDD
jgi:hypothetical protein